MKQIGEEFTLLVNRAFINKWLKPMIFRKIPDSVEQDNTNPNFRNEELDIP